MPDHDPRAQDAADPLETYETPASQRADACDDDRSNVND